MKSVWKYSICFCLFIAANPIAQTISQSAFASLNYKNYGLLNLTQTPVQDTNPLPGMLETALDYKYHRVFTFTKSRLVTL